MRNEDLHNKNFDESGGYAPDRCMCTTNISMAAGAKRSPHNKNLCNRNFKGAVDSLNRCVQKTKISTTQNLCNQKKRTQQQIIQM